MLEDIKPEIKVIGTNCLNICKVLLATKTKMGFNQKANPWDTWVSQSVKRLTSGHDPRVL